MSTKRWMASALAAGALAIGTVAVAPATTAHAATPSCTFGAIGWGTGWGANMLAHIPVYMPTHSTNCTMTTALGSSKNNAVFAMQDALRRCYGQGIAADGYFGAATKQALKNAQQRIGVTVDGVWGPRTSAAMYYPVLTRTGGYTGKCYPRNFFVIG